MPVLSTRIVLDCFYLLIFYSEKFSTDVCRLPYAVNVNLNLSINQNYPGCYISQILNGMQEGNDSSAKTLGKSRFHCHNNWSGNGPAGQF